MDYFSLIIFAIILGIILSFYLIRYLYYIINRNNDTNEYLLQEDESIDENSNDSMDIENNGIEINNNTIIDINDNPSPNKSTSRYDYIEYKSTLDEECPICLDTMLNTNIIQLKCMHKYHDKCLKEWYNKRKNSIICPECGF